MARNSPPTKARPPPQADRQDRRRIHRPLPRLERQGTGVVGMRRAIGRIGVLIAVALAAACATDAPDWTPGMTRISISAASPQGWTVLYALPEPATEWCSRASPTTAARRRGSRAPGSRLCVTTIWSGCGAWMARHSKRRLSLCRPPSRPADGLTTVFAVRRWRDADALGRFFACPTECADDAAWQVMLDAPGRSILIDGRRHAGRAMWNDEGSGRNVYVGETTPVETPDFLR